MLADEMEWDKVVVLSYKLSISSYVHERYSQILAHWYRCPVTFHKIDPTVSDVYWRCLRAPGTMLHIWGTRPRIVPFWEKMLQLYDTLVGDKYPN